MQVRSARPEPHQRPRHARSQSFCFVGAFALVDGFGELGVGFAVALG